MKKTIRLLILNILMLVLSMCISAYSQNSSMQRGEMGGGMQHPEFEKISEEDFYSGLNLSSEVKSKVEVILADFEEEFKAKMEGSNRPPQKEEMEVFIKARDEKIELLLTEEQYKTYKETVEGLFVPDEMPNMQRGRRGNNERNNKSEEQNNYTQQDKKMGGGMQHSEFEKISEEDFYAGLNLSSVVKSKVEVILADFEEEFKAKMEGSNRPPQKEEMESFIKARDEKIEPLLTEEQYKTYKETVEGLFVPEGGPGQGQGPRM